MDREAALLKVYAEPNRLRLAMLLLVNGETNVDRLVAGLSVPETRVSRHLGVMRDRGAVESRRQRNRVYYRLSKPRNRLEQRLHDLLRECLSGHATAKADLARLKRAKTDRQRAPSIRLPRPSAPLLERIDLGI